MIDPALIKSADFFKAVVMKFPLEKRIEIGSPVQYFLEHSPEECFNQLKRLTGYTDNALDFLIKLEMPTAFDKYETMRSILPEEFSSNPFIFTHVINDQHMVDLVEKYPQLINLLPPLIELTEGKYSKIELHRIGQSARKMFLVYVLFKSLNIDIDCFKYYKQSKDLEESLNSIGYSSKAIFKEIIRLSRLEYGTEGFLDQVLDIKYLNNYVDPQRAIHNIIGEMNRSSTPSSIVLNTIWAVIGSFVAIEGIYAYGGLSSIFRFYIFRYKRWANHSDVVIMDDGKEFYSHRHTMLSTFNRCLVKKANQWHDWVKLPDSIDTPPSILFADFIKGYAKHQHINLLAEYGKVTFKSMEDKFNHLDLNKFRYIDNAVDLVIEGRNMSHCVGGESYINDCAIGHAHILHYDDGDDRHGYTIELTRNVTHDDRHDLLFTSYDEQAEWWEGYQVCQIKGYDNNEPSDQVTLDILLALINASIKFREVPENEIKSEIHKYRVCMKNRHEVLHDHTTRSYHLVDVVGTFIPFKSSVAKEVNYRLLNPRLVYFDRDFKANLQMVPQEYANRIRQFIGREHAQDLAGDLRWDEFVEIPAQIMQRRMQGMYPREPDHNQVWFGGSREIETAGFPQLYPHQQTMLAAKHVAGHSYVDDGSSMSVISNVPLFELTKKLQTRNIGKSVTVTNRTGFRNNTGREYLIGQALQSLGILYGSWWRIEGKLPLMADLGMRLLANKMRYGFMSEEEIVKNIFLISDHGYNLFCSEVSILRNVTIGNIRRTGYSGIPVVNSAYSVTSSVAPYIPSMAFSEDDCEIIFSFSESSEMWNVFNNCKLKTNDLGFDFNDKFSRNLLGRYGIRFN